MNHHSEEKQTLSKVNEDHPESDVTQPADRRHFLSWASTVAMGGGLLTSYGALFLMAGRFLYPNRQQRRAWLFVTDVERMGPGQVIDFQTPAGQNVTITRRGNAGVAEDFLALSSVCPHLGCQVHWEGQNNRFFCPCHNGAFDADGNPTEGPPADANQTLPTFPLRVQNGMLFIEVPVESLG